MRRWFHKLLLANRVVTFLVLGLSFVAFGAGSLNLFFLLKANLGLLLEHGWLAVMDGGAQQLLELLLTGYLSMAAYLVFKTCEHHLVHWLGEPPADAHLPSTPLPPLSHEDRSPPR